MITTILCVKSAYLLMEYLDSSHDALKHKLLEKVIVAKELAFLCKNREKTDVK